jgi:hypothetical protein
VPPVTEASPEQRWPIGAAWWPGASVSGPAGGPYLRALLALREGPLLEQAVRALPITRRCWRSTPAAATVPAAPAWPGATAPLLLGGEVVGRARNLARPAELAHQPGEVWS